MAELFDDWQNRYLNNTCTLDHLQRLQAIGKLTEEEVRKILVAKRLKSKELN